MWNSLPDNVILASGVARNLIWGVYVLTSHCTFKTCVNVPQVNKTVPDFFWGGGGIYTDIPPVAMPLVLADNANQFKNRLDKHSKMHDIVFNYRAAFAETGGLA